MIVPSFMAMNITEKLSVLADAAKYDASCSSSGSKAKRGEKNQPKGLGSTEGMGICHSYTPDGRCISLLKILMTNYCIFDCKYCINRISSDVKRARFTTDEIVELTLSFYRRNYIEGLFLSSGIIQNSDYTMEQLVLVAKTLREVHNFRGYIHLKTIPGANDELLHQAGLYADRLSVNIELPTELDLKNLAPEKDQQGLEKNMEEVKTKALEIKEDRKKGMKTPIFVPAGQSTQMIVGATPTADNEILNTSVRLYDKYKLRRVYYSAFSPIPDSSSQLPSKTPPLMREHRLYQADWMLRFYGYKIHDIVSADNPNLELDIDPKTAWALRNRWFFPIDVNKADKEALLRIPGVGVGSVKKILAMRRHRLLRYDDLVKLHVAMNRAKFFITTIDYMPSALESASLQGQLRPQNKIKPQLSFNFDAAAY